MANDVITINGKILPYPSKFTMSKVPNIVAQLTTMSGKTIADVNGWKYADTTLSWGALLPDYMQDLIDATAASSFYVSFLDVDGQQKQVTAILKGFNHAKTRYQNDGSFVWEDVQVSLSFPECWAFTDPGAGGYTYWTGGSY